MKKGILVNNNFYTGKKMEEIDQFLIDSAEYYGMELCVKKAGELMHNYEHLAGLPWDYVLFWDKDVVLARMLESLGYRVFNSADAILNCDNKAYTYIRLSEAGIKTPRTIIAPLTYEGVNYCNDNYIEEALQVLEFPLVVKELYGSYGQQVYLVNDRKELDDLIAGLGSKGFLMQEFITSSFGRDVRVNVVGDQVISAMMRYNEHGDFRSNISNGGSMKPYELTEEQQALSIRACRALGLDFAGVDILFGEKEEPIVCEVNSNPNFKSSIDCTGIDLSRSIMQYIGDRLTC